MRTAGQPERSIHKMKIIKSILIAVAIITAINVVLSEIRVRTRISKVQLGMTEQEVEDICGKPTTIGKWKGSYGKGNVYIYSFPYWWDYIIWHLQKDKTNLQYARRCQIGFRTSDENSTVYSVEQSAPYSRTLYVIKSEEN